MESTDRYGYYHSYFNMSEYQRQTYISNYLDAGTDRNDIIYSKVKTTDLNTHEQDQNLQIKTASFADSHRHQFSRTVPDWSAGIPRYEFPQPESSNSYTMEQASQSCMYPNMRGCHQHFVNHAKSQLHWFRDQGRAQYGFCFLRFALYD